jgi:hypothetical protein
MKEELDLTTRSMMAAGDYPADEFDSFDLISEIERDSEFSPEGPRISLEELFQEIEFESL